MLAPILAMSTENPNKVSSLVQSHKASEWWRHIWPPKPMPFPLHHANVSNAVVMVKQSCGSREITRKRIENSKDKVYGPFGL